MISRILRFFRRVACYLHHPRLPERTLSSDEYFAMVQAGNPPLIAPNVNSTADEAKMPASVRELLAIPGVVEVRFAVCMDTTFPDVVSCDQAFVASNQTCFNPLLAWATREGSNFVLPMPGTLWRKLEFTKQTQTIYFIPWD